MDIFARRLKWLREKHGKTQKEVAEYMGVSQQYYGRFEKGQGQPNLEALTKLYYLFGESLEFLLGIRLFDNHASMLYTIYSQSKNKYERKQERLREFLEFINNEEIDDEELRRRITSILMSRNYSESEKIRYEKAKKYFIEYLKTIPGSEYIDIEEYIERVYSGREVDNQEYSTIQEKLRNRIFGEESHDD